jgi:hypothetical protein
MQVCGFYFVPVFVDSVSYSKGEKGRKFEIARPAIFFNHRYRLQIYGFPSFFRGGEQKKVLCGKQSTFLKYFIHEDRAS